MDISCLGTEIAEKCEQAKIYILPIMPRHIDYINKLPRIHNDPFDRLIVSQAIAEDMELITKDSVIPQYNVKTIW